LDRDGVLYINSTNYKYYHKKGVKGNLLVASSHITNFLQPSAITTGNEFNKEFIPVNFLKLIIIIIYFIPKDYEKVQFV